MGSGDGQGVKPVGDRGRDGSEQAADSAPGQSRRDELLDRAGELMAAKGYDGTSMRDIARAVGMLPGSLYYHFPSKEALFLALHDRMVETMQARVDAALDAPTAPWDRLEAACVAHVEGLIATGNLLAIVSPGFLDERDAISARIRAERSRYEQRFRHLVAALPLPAGVDRRVLRLHLFGALNWVPTWFDPGGGLTPEQIARQIFAVFRAAYPPAQG